MQGGIMTVHNNSDSYIRKHELRRITGLSDTTIWRLEKKKQFPQRRQLSASATGWLLSEVLIWLESRPAKQKEIK